jgi:hypothetical protein
MSKEALAASELASVAMMVCEPDGEPVTTKEQLNDPVPPVLHVEGEVVCAIPPKLIEMVEEAANPLPVTVTEVPCGPLAGLGEMDGVDALAWEEPDSKARSTTQHPRITRFCVLRGIRCHFHLKVGELSV